MTATVKCIRLTCPNCGSSFTSRVVEAGDSPDGPTPDLRVDAGIEPRHDVHECQRCGFAGRESVFVDGGLVTYELELERESGDALAPNGAEWTFEHAPEDGDDIHLDEHAMLTYLVGELWRRVGDRARPRTSYDRVVDEIVDREDQGWLLKIARRRRDDSMEWIV